jgi:hypothetical protein
MRPARIGRLPLVAAFMLLFAGRAGASEGMPEYLPPVAVPAPVRAEPPATAEDAKPDAMAKLYDPALTCDRPLRYGLFCRSKKKDCFQKATLFEWSVGCDPRKKDGNGSGNGGDEDEPEEEDRLQSDRPDFTEASTTVGRGRVQLEGGYTYFGDTTRGVRTITHSYPEALLRIGMFADWFELRLGETVFSETVTQNGIRTRNSGSADLYLGAKLALTKQKGVMPESALILQGTVPTGARAFTANRVLYGFNYLFGWDVTDIISVGGSFQANKSVDDTGRSYVLFAQSLTINYAIAKNLTAFTEWFAFYPAYANDTGSGGQHYYDGGFQYFVTNDFALDIRLGVGLSRSASDFFTGVGFVVRY